MTTIAYRDGIMACDSCWAYSGTQTTSASKIAKLSSGALLGASGDGDIRSFISMVDKIKTPDKLPSRLELAALRIDMCAVLAFPRGQVVMIEIGPSTGEHFDAQIWPANRGIAAAGSGADVALGAMAAGKSAKDAAAIACRFDINSRLPIHTMALKP